MIHPEDWAVVLRWPRLETFLSAALFILGPAALVVGIVAGFNHFSRRRMSKRALATVGLAVAVMMSAFWGYIVVGNRLWQAACWRLGPGGMPASERESCERLPPQGVEGFY